MAPKPVASNHNPKAKLASSATMYNVEFFEIAGAAWMEFEFANHMSNKICRCKLRRAHTSWGKKAMVPERGIEPRTY